MASNRGNAVARAVLASGGRITSALSPLVEAMEGYQTDERYNPIQRPAGIFTGAFAPGSPIEAAPIDTLRDDGRPDPRRFQYPVGWNLPVGQPGTEGLKLCSFAQLRSMADVYSVARSCVDHCIAEIVGLGWDVVPTAEATQKMKGDVAKREDWEARRKEVVQFFRHPDSDRGKYPTFESWLGAILEDRYVIDAVAIHLRATKIAGAGPFGSSLASLDLLDGSTIRPLLDVSGATPMPPAPAYQQYIWGVPRTDMLQVISKEDIKELGMSAREFRADQLLYMRDKSRTWTPYGYSPIEKAKLPISIGLARQLFQNDYFQEGSIPGQFIDPGETIETPNQAMQLQRAMNSMASDPGHKHRIVVMPRGAKPYPQKPIALADQFDEIIVTMVAMPFELTTMDLGMTPRVSAVQSPSESREMSEVNTEKGSKLRIEPVTTQLKSDLFDYVIQQVFGQEDMEWCWDPTNAGKNKTDDIQNHVSKIQNGMESIDEARVAMGDIPWGLPETSVPLMFTSQGVLPITMITAQYAAAMTDEETDIEDSLADSTSRRGGAGLSSKPGGSSNTSLTTPAHEAVRAATGTPPSGSAKSVAAELEILNRYLRKGKPIEEFKSDILSDRALVAAAEALNG